MSELLVIKIPIPLIGVTITLSLVAVAVYLLSVYFGTRYARPVWAVHPVLISWVISAPVFLIIWALSRESLTLGVIVQYAILTLLLNGGLKITHVIWDYLAKRYMFVPIRRRAPGAVSAGGGQ